MKVFTLVFIAMCAATSSFAATPVVQQASAPAIAKSETSTTIANEERTLKAQDSNRLAADVEHVSIPLEYLTPQGQAIDGSMSRLTVLPDEPHC